jgi:hypothetical protein
MAMDIRTLMKYYFVTPLESERQLDSELFPLDNQKGDVVEKGEQ